METQEEINEICENYVTGVKWVFLYYFKGCPSWDWKYNYRHPPLISSICNYLENVNINQIKFGSSKPVEPVNQLLYILPKGSKNLVPYEYQKLYHNNYFYPDQFGVDMIFKRYFWQTQPILPDMNYGQLKKMYNKIKKQGKNSNLQPVIIHKC